MIPFQYQVLRYQPDRISAEFVNVGVVVFSPKVKFVRAEFIDSIARVSGFFHGINTHHIKPTLKHIEQQIEKHQKTLGQNRLFEEYRTVEQLVYSILPKDDSSLYFAEPLGGLTADIELEYEKLTKRLLFAYNEHEEHKQFQNDEQVWSKLYRQYFRDAGIEHKLSSYFVRTPLEQLEFPYAYKNDIYHCYEPHNFDLANKESIKRKAHTIAGRLMELQSSNEEIEVNILSVLPQNKPDVTAYLKKKLNNVTFGKSRVNLLTPDEAAKEAKEAKKQIEAHEKQ